MLYGGFCRPNEPQRKNKRKQKHRQILARELKVTVEYEGDGITNCWYVIGTLPKDLEKQNEGIGKQRKNQNHQNSWIV